MTKNARIPSLPSRLWRGLSLTGRSIAVLALVIGCTSTTEKELTAEQKKGLVDRYTETAQEYLRMGELDRAEGQTLKALALDPKNVKCKMIRGWTLQKRGSSQDILVAERIFREILDGGDYRATLGLAECLERKGVAFEEASEAISSGKRVSEAPDPVARAKQLLVERDRAWAESIQRYERTLVEHADDVDALNGAMRVTALLARIEESLAYAEKLILVIGPTRDFWQKQVVGSDVTAENEKLYRERINHLVDLELATRVHASTLLHQLKRNEGALAHLDAAIALDPERPELYSRRAEIQQSLGHPDKALVDIDQFLRRSTQTYDHPDVKRAWRLRKECEDAMRAGESGNSGEAH
jgi:tetratricopeptide (TPR) repeat protein